MRPPTIADVEEELTEALLDDDADAIARLGAELDKLDVRPTPVAPVSAALFYAKRLGLHVFPLSPLVKIPFGKCRECRKADCRGPATCGHDRCHGCLDATVDEAQIREWWTRHPDANVAIATGHRVDVIDVDGPLGNKSIAAVLDDLPPILGRVTTPRPGGRHLYVTAVEGRGNRAKLLPGVDYRGLGGYVVAPPSTLDDRDGQIAGRYEWVVPLDLEAAS